MFTYVTRDLSPCNLCVTLSSCNEKLPVNYCTIQYLSLLLQTNNRNYSYYEFEKECVGSDSG